MNQPTYLYLNIQACLAVEKAKMKRIMIIMKETPSRKLIPCKCNQTINLFNSWSYLGSIGLIAPLSLNSIEIAGGGFNSYYIHQRNELDKERKIKKKKQLSFMQTKDFINFFKTLFDFLTWNT